MRGPTGTLIRCIVHRTPQRFVLQFLVYVCFYIFALIDFYLTREYVVGALYETAKREDACHRNLQVVVARAPTSIRTVTNLQKI